MSFLFFKKKKPSASQTQPLTEVMDYRAAAATDVGSVRKNNEDNLIFIRPYDKKLRSTHGCMALVADGMGGHSNGELASRMATEIISRTYFDSKLSVLDALKQAFEKANKAIFYKANLKSQYKGMGTTCTAVVLLGQNIYLAHVGDSRAYLLQGQGLTQLSSDHTYVQHLLDKGQITYEESLSHPQRNVVTRAMGTSPKLKADYLLHKKTFHSGDRLLICSDGLYEYIQDAELGKILRNQGVSLHETGKHLISIAKQRGGHDNISVLIAETFQSNPTQVLKQTQKLS